MLQYKVKGETTSKYKVFFSNKYVHICMYTCEYILYTICDTIFVYTVDFLKITSLM